ncbi:anti-sigma factor family protein [Candidatus Riflebacteria bacterium]
MDCQDFRELIDIFDNFPDTELNSQERIEFRIHEKECPGCRGEFRISQKIRQGLYRLNSIEVPKSQIERLKRKLKLAGQQEPEPYPPLLTRIFPLLRFSTSMAIVLFIFFASNYSFNTFNKQQISPPQEIRLARVIKSPQKLKLEHKPRILVKSNKQSIYEKQRRRRDIQKDNSPIVFVSQGFNFDRGSLHPSNIPMRPDLRKTGVDQIFDEIYSPQLESFLMKKYAIRSLIKSRSTPKPLNTSGNRSLHNER